MNPKIVLLIEEYDPFSHNSSGIPFHPTSFLNWYSQLETSIVKINRASEVTGISTVMINMAYEVFDMISAMSDILNVNSDMIFDLTSEVFANGSSLNSGIHRFISKKIHS